MQNWIKYQGKNSPLKKAQKKIWSENQMSEPVKRLKNEVSLSCHHDFAWYNDTVHRSPSVCDPNARCFWKSELVEDHPTITAHNSTWYKVFCDHLRSTAGLRWFVPIDYLLLLHSECTALTQVTLCGDSVWVVILRGLIQGFNKSRESYTNVKEVSECDFIWII